METKSQYGTPIRGHDRHTTRKVPVHSVPHVTVKLRRHHPKDKAGLPGARCAMRTPSSQTSQFPVMGGKSFTPQYAIKVCYQRCPIDQDNMVFKSLKC